MTDAEKLLELEQAILEFDHKLQLKIWCGEHDVKDKKHKKHRDWFRGYIDGLIHARVDFGSFIGETNLEEMYIRFYEMNKIDRKPKLEE